MTTTHPAWCDTTECTAEPGHLHYSKVFVVEAPTGFRDSAQISLVIHGTNDTQPICELIARPTAGPVLVADCDTYQLRALNAAITQVLTLQEAAR